MRGSVAYTPLPPPPLSSRLTPRPSARCHACTISIARLPTLSLMAAASLACQNASLRFVAAGEPLARVLSSAAQRTHVM